MRKSPELTGLYFPRRTDKASGAHANKDANEIDQVAGNAEDDIGDNIAFIRESELLYGEDSLLTVYGPLIAEICANPKRYKVRRLSLLLSPRLFSTFFHSRLISSTLLGPVRSGRRFTDSSSPLAFQTHVC